ncbi:DUF302 domain-containing protein [Paraburkholderia sp. MMS20-SJTN17]|uniref:DUF302 domain-containing protein n=1 Tax=Paraburkholderia translucens TaxID=2886945 RepID=A0ABS8KD73_9BURK|nr:DUF302 domain-containing protein [Paraburkholderia sp. MMS20-SJTN17]MCC8402725.1 DUF302 domain-containing protein [Paraburkholderia sp. MMS20-SJTN17]
MKRLEAMQGPYGLMRFDKLDHGALFAMAGAPRLSVRYSVGNPLIAWSMTRIDMRAALHAPLTVLVYGLNEAQTRIEYDLPSAALAQFGCDAIHDVALDLDGKLNGVIESAARFSAVIAAPIPAHGC